MEINRPDDTASLGKRRRLLLHIGMTKAGSTAIQNYLDRCRSALLESGVLFPRSGFSRRNPYDLERTGGHLPLTKEICSGHVQELEAEIEAADPCVLLLSAENLFLDVSDAFLEKLADYFRGWDVTLILILRSQQEWLCSRYVEDVMGVRRSTLLGEQFVAKALAAGSLDYHAAIDRAVRLLSASKLSLINYDSCVAQSNLVKSFLDVAGLPATDLQLANSIRANVREKEGLLVEGKRRLNHFLQQCRGPLLLHVEAEFRRLSSSFFEERSAGAHVVDVAWVPLSTDACREISKANADLSTDRGLVVPLLDPAPICKVARQHRDNSPGIDELVQEGLHLAARLGQHGHLAHVQPGRRPFLFITGAHRLIDLLRCARSSVHVCSSETARMAAAFCSKTVVYLSNQGEAEAETNDLLELKLPSEVMCLCWDGTHVDIPCRDAIDVITARETPGLDALLSGLVPEHPAAVLVLVECSPAMVIEMAVRFERAVVHEGDCAVLVPVSSNMRACEG